MYLLPFVQQHIGLSRRKAFSAIQDGLVLVNGAVAESSKHPLVAGDDVELHGVIHTVPTTDVSGGRDQEIVLFHKPTGCVVSQSDPHNTTIYSLLPAIFRKHFYIGRLDKNSEGLLLLTKNRQLVHRLQHPSFGWEKVYHVELDRPWKSSDGGRAMKGLRIDEHGVILPPRHAHKEYGDLLRCVKLSVLPGSEKPGSRSTLKMTLKEGKKRHIRRLLHALGYRIHTLKRVSFGPFSLGKIPSGEFQIKSDDFLATLS